MTFRLRTLLGAAIGAALVVLMGASPASAVVFPYRIDMQTCDLSGAGTDGYVSARVFGSAGSSGWIELNTQNHDDFERGNVDAFYFNLPTNIGTVQSVNVFFQPSGSNSAWCLSWVRVNGPTGTSPLLRYNNSSLWFVSTGTQGPWLP